MHVYIDDAQLQRMLLVNRRWRASPFFHMSDARRKSLLRLTAEVRRLRLSQANLVSTGNKQALVELPSKNFLHDHVMDLCKIHARNLR